MAFNAEDAAKAMLPGFVACAAAWLLNMHSIRSSPAALLALLAAYAFGIIILRSISLVGLSPSPNLYIFYVLMVLFGGTMAVSLLRGLVLNATLSSFLLLPVIMFALPALSEFLRLRDVRTE